MELPGTLTSIPNLTSDMPLEINSSVSGISLIKILRSGMGYILRLSSISILVSLGFLERSTGFLSLFPWKPQMWRVGKDVGGKGANQEGWELSPEVDPVNVCFMVGVVGDSRPLQKL